ncbi:MAG: ABC transporter permease [Eubacteriales bacterium]
MGFLDYVTSNWANILNRTGQHVGLAFTAVGIACVVGVPLGIVITKNKRAANIVISIANVIQTIPSLALFAFVIPILGIGSKNAIFALFLYSLLPIIKNTYIGIQNVDPAIIEAAKGMGMSRAQILYKVQMALAISVIMGGVRIAAVTCIGVATIATLIGAGGLGSLIYQGISMVNFNMIFAGAIPAALLAILIDLLLGWFEKLLTSEGLRRSNG